MASPFASALDVPGLLALIGGDAFWDGSCCSCCGCWSCLLFWKGCRVLEADVEGRTDSSTVSPAVILAGSLALESRLLSVFENRGNTELESEPLEGAPLKDLARSGS